MDFFFKKKIRTTKVEVTGSKTAQGIPGYFESETLEEVKQNSLLGRCETQRWGYVGEWISIHFQESCANEPLVHTSNYSNDTYKMPPQPSTWTKVNISIS